MGNSVTYGPTFFTHVQRFYRAMHTKAKPHQVNGQQVTLYRGKVTRLFYGLDLPTSYYGAAMRVLKQMGCVTVISRGAGRYTDSEVALHHPPAWEGYEEAVKVVGRDESVEKRRARALRKAKR